MARVHRGTFAARKPREGARRTMPTTEVNGETVLRCGRGDFIRKGETYLFFAVGFRGSRQYRCTKHYPRPSELDGSLMSSVLAAQEDASDALGKLATDAEPDELISDVDSIVESVRDAVTEVVDQYRDSAEAMGGSYGAGAQMEEWADNLEAAGVMDWRADSYEDAPEGCDDGAEDGSGHDEFTEGCEKCLEAREEWARGLIEEAGSQIDDISKE